MSGTRITIRKSACELELTTDAGAEQFSVGIGSNPDGRDKSAVGDCRTPEGAFLIVSIEDASEWEHEGRRSYGAHFLRLNCPSWEGIGIHGTDEPDSVGTKSSRGCIRMLDADLERVVSAVCVGTVVTIVP
ncbi:L,D-transpeptidase [bacterium]|nr:L,D-transpeptidase [bacterium]